MKKTKYKEDLMDMLLYNAIESNEDNNDRALALKEISQNTNVQVQKLLERYAWLKQMNIDPNVIKLKENHEQVLEIFDACNKMFNENNIEYYHTSGILSYLLVDKELERYHHDLDIFVNMEHLKLLEDICGNYDFCFKRKFGARPDGTQRIMLKMYYKDLIEIPITIFMYVLEADLSVTQKDYYFDKSGNLMVENIYNSTEIATLSFSDIIHYHNQIGYYAISLEALYMSKAGNRPKDIYDCNIFEKQVNKDLLNKLYKAFERNKKNGVTNGINDKYYDFILADKSLIRKLDHQNG